MEENKDTYPTEGFEPVSAAESQNTDPQAVVEQQEAQVPQEPQEPAKASKTPTPPRSEVPRGLTTTALTLSTVFSPLLVPTYACAIALWITPLSFIWTEKGRFIIASIVFVLTSLVPMGVILFMMRAGKVSDTSITNRRERGIPYLVTAGCYVVAAAFLGSLPAPHWLTFFFGGACFSTLMALVINTVWKISAHATVMGGLCAMVIFIGLHGMGVVWMLPWVTGAVLVSGAVGSARLLLKRHTAAQVYAGWLLGLIVEFFFMSF